MGLLRLLRFMVVIIHPFHRISEDARHCSALSYRQVADCDYRVPEVINRHSFTVVVSPSPAVTDYLTNCGNIPMSWGTVTLTVERPLAL